MAAALCVCGVAWEDSRAFSVWRGERDRCWNIARSGKMGWVRQEDGETDRERDRHILVLLLQDVTSPANVAAALDVSYSAAAKAIQRVKDRISTMLVDEPSERESKGSSLRSSEN